MKFGNWAEFPAVLASARKKMIHFDLAPHGASSRWGNPAPDYPASEFVTPSSTARPT